MTRLVDLLPASFDGVPFLVRREILSNEGRRIILHDYPNSDTRFVEDLGQLPSIFRVDAFVHGNDAAARRDALRSALNSSGARRLVLPSFGSNDVYAMDYTVEADQKAVGIYAFSLQFAAGRPAAGPVLTLRDLQEVYDLADEARGAIEDELQTSWQPPISDRANAELAAYDLVQAIQEAINQIGALLPTEPLGHVQRIQQSVNRSSFTVIREGLTLAKTLIGTNVSGLGQDGFWQSLSIGFSQLINADTLAGSSVFSGLMDLMQFGRGLTLRLSDLSGDFVDRNAPIGTVPLWPRTTAGRDLRNNNRLRIVNTTRVNALVTGYEVLAARDYRTQAEVVTARQQIEEQNERLMRVGTGDATVIQSAPAVRAAVENTRLAALEVLDQKRNQTFDITTFYRATPGSAVVEAYRLYGQDFTAADQLVDRALELRNLNPMQSAVAMQGNITALKAR